MDVHSLENFKRMLAGKRPERMPFDFLPTAPVEDFMEKEYGSRDPVQAFGVDFGNLHPKWKKEPEKWEAAYRAMGFAFPEDYTIGFAGFTQKIPSRESLGAAYHLKEVLHPLEGIELVEELEALPWPDLTDPEPFAEIPAEVERYHALGKVATGWQETTVFEFAWYQRSMQMLFMDMAEENGIADWLLDWFTERSCESVKAFAKAGVDVIRLGDDIGVQNNLLLSMEMWRTHLKPRLAKVIGVIREHQTQPICISYHSDGNITQAIPELIYLGIDMINPVQPEAMEPGPIVRDFKDRLGFWGIIGTQSTLPFGSPEEVREKVKECAEWCRGGAKIVVAPTHVVEPDVSPENIRAFIETAKAPL